MQNTKDDVIEIDLAEIFYLLWGHIVQIVACLVAGAVAAFAFTMFFVTPMYSATAKMYIVSSGSSNVVDLSDLQISNNLRSDYKELLTNRLLLEDVVNNLDLQISYQQLNSMIQITNPSDTRIINVTVTSPDGKDSANIANELVNLAKKYLPEIMKTDEPSVYEPAIVPTHKTSPSYSKNTLIGGILAAFAYMAVIIIRHLMNDTLVTPDDVNKYLGFQPLATIPEGNLGSFNREKDSKKSKKKGSKK